VAWRVVYDAISVFLCVDSSGRNETLIGALMPTHDDAKARLFEHAGAAWQPHAACDATAPVLR
jgi:hypothetical protein